jgi:hypothetical protein
MKSRINTSWRASGCRSGVSRSEAQQTGRFGFSGPGDRSTPPCRPSLTNCWIEWRCHSRPRSTSTVSLGETIFTKVVRHTTSAPVSNSDLWERVLTKKKAILRSVSIKPTDHMSTHEY